MDEPLYRQDLESAERLDTLNRPPVSNSLEGPALEVEEGMHPAGAAVPVGVTANLVEARRHHDRANGPEAAVEAPWHLTSRPCRPNCAEVVSPQSCSARLCPKRSDR